MDASWGAPPCREVGWQQQPELVVAVAAAIGFYHVQGGKPRLEVLLQTDQL